MYSFFVSANTYVILNIGSIAFVFGVISDLHIPSTYIVVGGGCVYKIQVLGGRAYSIVIECQTTAFRTEL